MAKSPYYLNQIALIENISKSIPINTTLLVKEHKGMLGHRDLGYYKELKKIIECESYRS